MALVPNFPLPVQGLDFLPRTGVEERGDQRQGQLAIWQLQWLPHPVPAQDHSELTTKTKNENKNKNQALKTPLSCWGWGDPGLASNKHPLSPRTVMGIPLRISLILTATPCGRHHGPIPLTDQQLRDQETYPKRQRHDHTQIVHNNDHHLMKAYSVPVTI